MWIGGCGDHGGVVSGEGATREKYSDVHRGGFGCEAIAQFGVGGYSSGNQHCAGTCFGRGLERARHKVADDCGLELGNYGERSRAAKWKQIGGFAATFVESFLAGIDFLREFGMRANVVQDGGLDSAEAEIVGIAFDFYRSKIRRVFSAEFFAGGGLRRELVDDRAARIAEREEPGNFVVGFAGGVVARAAEAAEFKSALGGIAVALCVSLCVWGRRLHVVQQRVSTGDD